MEADRLKWNERYDGEEYLLGVSPSSFLVERIDFLLARCPGRTALDIACGEGRNSVYLAEQGFAVTGIDISEAGLAKGKRLMATAGVTVDFRAIDLDMYELSEWYDLIINCNYLQRDLIPRLAETLTPGGIILFETLLSGPNAPPTRSPDHLLAPGELASLFAPLPGVILYSAELPGDPYPVARLMFQRHR